MFKKLFAYTLILTMVLSLFGGFSISVMADDVSTIAYVSETDAPEIDGTIDDIWANADALYTSNTGGGSVYEATGSYAKVLWNEKGFYYLAEVKDSTITNLDRVNIWVSEVYTDVSAPYSSSEADGNYAFCISPEAENILYTPLDVSSYWTAKTTKSDEGYIIEVFMPVIGDDDLVAGNAMGLDISIDRYSSTTKRDYYEYYNGAGRYWDDVSALKKMTLLAESSGEPEEPEKEKGLVFEYDLSSENTFNTGANGSATPLPVEGGGMVINNKSHNYSTKTADGYGSAIGGVLTVGSFTKIVLTLGLKPEVTSTAQMEIYLMNVANNYASGSVIAAQAIKVEAGTGYKNYIYNYADLSKGGYNKEGNAIRQISLVSKSDNPIYVRSIKFVTDEWVEDTSEVFPEVGADGEGGEGEGGEGEGGEGEGGEPVEPEEPPVETTTEAVYEFDLRKTNTYNTGANNNTTVAPIENRGMKLEGSGIWYSTQTAANGYGSSFISCDKFTRVAFKAKLDESVTEDSYLTFYLNWTGHNSASYNKVVSGSVLLEAGAGYKTYVCDLKEAIANSGMPTHPVRQMGINNNGATMYVQSIKFVTDNWVEGEEVLEPEGPGSIVATVPANNATSVAVDSDLVLELDEVPDLSTFTRANICINGSYDMVETVEGQTGLNNFVTYDPSNNPYEIKINLKPLAEGTRYVVELKDIGVGTSKVNYHTVFTTGIKTTPTTTVLKHYDLTTENTYNSAGAPIENGGMHLTGSKIYYTPQNQWGAALCNFDSIDKIIFKAKLADGATQGQYLTFYFMHQGLNNANYKKITTDYFWMDPTDDYQTYVVDLSDNVASVLASGTSEKVLRQMGINNNGADMYIADIKFVPAGYTDSTSVMTKGFEMIQNFGTATERNISYVGLPDEPGDVSAVVNLGINLASEPTVVTVAAALYEGDKLVDVKMTSQPLAAGQGFTEPLVATLEDVPAGENYVVRGFLWNQFNPIAPNYTLGHAKKVLIIGNSITQHAPNDFTSSYGVVWDGMWGMAVTKEENDYAHLLMKYAKNAGYQADIRVGGNIWRTDHSVGSIESNPAVYQTTEALDDSTAADFAAFDPDIIIMADGANASKVDEFITAYELALDYIDVDDDAKVITVGTVCGSAPWAKVSELAAEKDWPYVDRTQAAGYATYDYMAMQKWGSNAVGWHPGDAGMKAIADGVWEYLNAYLAE